MRTPEQLKSDIEKASNLIGSILAQYNLKLSVLNQINLTPTMKNYKVLEVFALNGVDQVVSSVVELSDEQAVEFVGKVELVVVETPAEEAKEEAVV